MKKMKIKRRFFKRISVFLFLSLIGTIFILNPNIIEATTVENEAEQLIELPTVHSNFYSSETYSKVMETSLNNVEFVSLKGQKYFPNVNKDTEYQINYEVDLSKLTPNMMKKYDEIVIAVDVSSYMESSWKQVKDFFANYFENSLGSKEVKMGIVPFNNQVVKPDTSHNNDFDFTNMLDLSNDDKVNINMIKNAFGWGYIKPDTDVGTRAIYSALDQADTLLNSGESENQVIIIITSGGYDNVDQNKLETFSQKSYDIMTYDVADKQDQSAYSASDVHQMLGGKTNKFFKINSDSLEDLEQSQEIVKQLKGIIGSVTTNSNSLTENLKVDLKFNFGEYIEYVENSYRINDTSSENILENEKTVLPLYNGKITEQDGLMKDIDFKVKIKDLTSSCTFTSAEIVYQYKDWPQVIEKIESPKFGIIKPHISATLSEDWDPPITTLGDKVEISYTLNADNFEYDQSSDNELKEIVILLDSTAENAYYNQLDKLLKMIKNRILNEHNVKLGLVIYDQSTEGIKDYVRLTSDMREIENAVKKMGQSQGNPQITLALKKAGEILDEGVSKSKSIIIINEGNAVYNKEEIMSFGIKYNIFIMERSGQEKNIESLVQDLKLNPDNYKTYGGHGRMDSTLESILNNLKSQVIDGYLIKGTKLVFDLGENFVESNTETNKVEILLEPIHYQLKDVNGKKQYVAQNISSINEKISFIVKSLTTGNLNFRENTSKEMFNYISYIDLDGTLVQLPLETPTIQVKSKEPNKILKHGLYLNPQGSNPIIQENDLFTVFPSMNATFGMTMDIKSSNAKFTIEIPKSIGNTAVQLNDVWIYELTSEGIIDSSKQSQSLGEAVREGESKYYITNITNNEDTKINLEENKKYLITYSVKFNNEENNSTTSSFRFIGKLTGSSDKEISLELKDFSSLPDLL